MELNPDIPSVLTSETAKGEPKLYWGECTAKQPIATVEDMFFNISYTADPQTQETVSKLQQWVLEPDPDFRILNVTINDRSFNPSVPVRLTDSYDGLLHPARLALEIQKEEYRHVGKAKAPKKELPDFMGARLAFYDELAAAGIEKESFNVLLDRYEHSHGYSALAFDSASNYRDTFKNMLNNDFCRHLNRALSAAFFINKTSSYVQAIATSHEANDIIGCLMQDFGISLITPTSMIAHISNLNPVNDLGIRTSGYQLEQFLLARIPEHSKKIIRKGMGLERALFSQLQNTHYRNQFAKWNTDHRNSTTKYHSPLLNYTTVLVTDSTNPNLLNLSEVVNVAPSFW